jgi:exonuclease III
MRVVTWNMAYWTHRRHHEAAWRWALDELKPDVLLVQEAVIPEWVRARFKVHWTRSYEDGQQTWGTGLVTVFPFEPARVPALDEWFRSVPSGISDKPTKAGIYQADNWFSCAHVELPGVGRTLVGSVHSPAFPIEKSRLRGIDVSPMKLKKNPDLWFLDVLFHFLRPMLGQKFIVGGDFNASRLLDTTLGERGNNEFFDRVHDEGFVSLHRRFHDADERTYFKAGKAPHQLDYLYADVPAAAGCRACKVQHCGEFSDHAPLVADFV